jgi:outer membrane protein TolC
VTAEQNVYSAQQALMSARFDLLSSKVAIQKALGRK